MAYLKNNLEGLRFHKLSVLRRSLDPELRRQGYWECSFDCGVTKQIISNSLRTGIVKSCGSANCKSTTNYKDLTAQRFGRLQALTFYSKNKKRYWICICDCGKQNIVRTANLTSGQVRSCGCLARDIASRNAKLKRLPEGISARNTVVNGYKKSAVKAGRVWELSDGNLNRLFEGNCHYCGDLPSNCRKTKSGDLFYYNGIDRKNNDLGYTLDNVVSCCRDCNMAKSGRTYEDFLSWLQRITRFQKDKL